MRNLTSGLINLNLQGNDLSSFKNGVASSIDDNLLFGAIKWLCKKNDAAHENDYYFMLGKTKTDAAFLASFLLTVKGSVESAYRAIMNSTAAAGFAIVTSETAIGGLIGGMAATEELIRAGILTGVSIVASAMVTRTTNILYIDAKKFKRIIDKAKAEAIAKLEKSWAGKLFESAEKFEVHYGKHASEWSTALTREQYLAKARDLLGAKLDANIEGFVSKEGWIFKYNNATNEFAIGRPNDIISTVYRPIDGRAYWLDQIKLYGGEAGVLGGK